MKKLSKIAVSLAAVAAMAFGCVALVGCGGSSGGGSVGINTVGYDDGTHSVVLKITNDTTDTLLISQDGDINFTFTDDGNDVAMCEGLVLDPIYLPAGEETIAVLNYWTEEDVTGCVCTAEMGNFNPVDVAGISATEDMDYSINSSTTDDGFKFDYKVTYTGDNADVNGFRVVTYGLDGNGNVLAAETVSEEYDADKSVQAEGNYNELPGCTECCAAVYPTIIAM